MSKVSLVMTILGEDRAGLVESLADVVKRNGGNWLESRMAHLAGQFAGILCVEVEPENAALLTDALRALESQGLQLIVHSEATPEEASEAHQGLIYLELVGQDRPGIVSEISRVLATHGVNVEDLSTEQISAANSGQKLFRATVKLQLPSAAAGAKLRAELEQIAADLMVDLNIHQGGS